MANVSVFGNSTEHFLTKHEDLLSLPMYNFLSLVSVMTGGDTFIVLK